MGIIKKIKAYSFSVAILYIIIGLIMIFNPTFITNAINYVLGSLIMVYGIVYLINLYNKKDYEIFSKFDFLAGVLIICFGVFLIKNSDLLKQLLPFCAGVILFLDGIYQIKDSLVLKEYKASGWFLNLIIGLLLVGFALYTILNTNEVEDLMIKIIGGVLIFDSLMDFYTFFRIKKFKRSVKKEIENVIEAVVKE